MTCILMKDRSLDVKWIDYRYQDRFESTFDIYNPEGVEIFIFEADNEVNRSSC